MITIGQPYIYEDGEYAFLKAKIDVSDDTALAYIEASKVIKKVHWRTSENYPPKEWLAEDSGLWFAVPIEYKKYLCSERSDAFVVAMLWYAMVTGSDIVCTSTVSERMLFHINKYLIPALCTSNNGYRRIKVSGPTSDEKLVSANGVGTGMSCGIDSLYTLNEYTRADIPEKYRLTHLTYFNMGAIFHPDRDSKQVYTIKEFYEKTDQMSEEKRENARQVAQKAGMPLVYVKSNFDSDYYRGAYGHTGVYRNCSMALALQGLFSIYYCSSGGAPEVFGLSLTEASQLYESLLCLCFSTETLSFKQSDCVARIEKTLTIADNKIAQEYLDVCFRFHNCGQCSKCIRTLITLDIIGKLDDFKNVFDIESFKQHREEAYYSLLKAMGKEGSDESLFAKDLYRLASEKGCIPQSSIKRWEKEKRLYKVKYPIKRILKLFK